MHALSEWLFLTESANLKATSTPLFHPIGCLGMENTWACKIHLSSYKRNEVGYMWSNYRSNLQVQNHALCRNSIPRINVSWMYASLTTQSN